MFRPYGVGMTSVSHVVTGPDAVDVLTGSSFVPPPAEPGPVGGLRWLRHSVARFSHGADHARRREAAVRLLAPLDLDVLRARAREETRDRLTVGVPCDVMSRIARDVPVTVLGEAIGLARPDVAAVRAVAAHYLAGTADAAADAGVAALVAAFGGVADESTAAAIGVLAQACEATAGLIGVAVAGGPSDVRPADVVAEVLRARQPVRSTVRRVSVPVRAGGVGLAAGDVVGVDLTGLPFGAGAHGCPGAAHAVALAVGVCEALEERAWRVVDVGFASGGDGRVPVRCEVVCDA
ncbi:cytochrome P450 [Stackebrandtia albiflava]|uniref:Cytochrome P450 n=2 Tax=Stackebrandtia albiflava TaxID=406432 RepID=A0A562VES2_9ACTN|nr:cytochrome P450 [Stackebrandtia albiflava]